MLVSHDLSIFITLTNTATDTTIMTLATILTIVPL